MSCDKNKSIECLAGILLNENGEILGKVTDFYMHGYMETPEIDIEKLRPTPTLEAATRFRKGKLNG